MAIIEVNLAGFQFTRCVPDTRDSGTRQVWHFSGVPHPPRIHKVRRMRRWLPRPRVA